MKDANSFDLFYFPSNEYLVSGAQDGKIHVYEAALRTRKPIISFDIGKQVVSIVIWKAGYIERPFSYVLFRIIMNDL